MKLFMSKKPRAAHEGGKSEGSNKSRPFKKLLLGMAMVGMMTSLSPASAEAANCSRYLNQQTNYENCVLNQLPRQINTSATKIQLNITNYKTGRVLSDMTTIYYVAGRDLADSWKIYRVIPEHNFVQQVAKNLPPERMLSKMTDYEADLRYGRRYRNYDDDNIIALADDIGMNKKRGHILHVLWDFNRAKKRAQSTIKWFK